MDKVNEQLNALVGEFKAASLVAEIAHIRGTVEELARADNARSKVWNALCDFQEQNNIDYRSVLKMIGVEDE